MTRLIFVRHGESEANLRDVFAGDFNAPLTARGRMQARRTAEALQHMRIDAAYASDLDRAWETGRIIAEPHGLVPVPERGLREIGGGLWEGVPFCGLKKRFAEDYGRWMQDLANARPTGGESVRELAVRVRQTCERIAEQERGHTVLIASHATPIRTMQMVWMGLDIGRIATVPWVRNASYSVAEYEGGRWTMISADNAEHLSGLETALPENI